MNIDQILENMTQEEMEQLMAIDFGADLEKQASTELAQADLAEALYAYGAFLADSEISATEELSKEASAEIEQAAQEIGSVVEQALNESGILEIVDTAELHKEAQAAAGFIFQGYADQLEKAANDEGKMSKMKKMIAEKAEKSKEKAKELGKKGLELAKKHKVGLGLGAAGLAAAGGAYAYKKHQEKKASEISATELMELMEENQVIDATISEGISKLAAAGVSAKPEMVAKVKEMAKKLKEQAAKAGDKVKAGAKAAKQYAHANPGKAMLAGAALGAGGALLAKKKKDE